MKDSWKMFSKIENKYFWIHHVTLETGVIADENPSLQITEIIFISKYIQIKKTVI